MRPEIALTLAAVAALELRRSRRAALLLVAGGALVVVPYVVYLHAVTGRWSPSSKMLFLERALEVPAPGALAISYLQQARALGAALVGATGMAIPVAALVGMVLRPQRWVAVATPLLGLPVFLFPMDARYWAPYLPLLFTSAWLGIDGALMRFGGRPARLATAAVAATVLLGNAATATAPAMYDIATSYEYFPGMRDAGAWLRSRVDRSTIVAARKPYVSFWAGCDFARIPDALDPSAIVAWARGRGAGWLVVNVWEVMALAPSMRPLAEGVPSQLLGQIEPAETFQVDIGPEHTTRLYRVLPAPDADRPAHPAIPAPQPQARP
jgi:hypothetical protein